MKNRPRFWTALALALAWGGATACDDTNGPPAEGDLRIVAPRTHLVPGETLELRVEDGDGTDVTDRVVWTTDDATTLAVDDGVVTGVAAGYANVAAALDGDVATERFNVRFGDVGAGSMALRIQGDESDPLRFGGFAFLMDWMGDPATADEEQYDYTVIYATASDDDPLIPDSIHSPTDTVFSVSFPGRPAVGAQRLPSFEAVEMADGTFTLQGGTGALLHIRNGVGELDEMWIPVDGFDLEFDAVELPDQAGLPHGTVRGRASFEAAGLLVSIGENGMTAVDQIGEETVRIYIEFETRIRINPRGAAALVLTGPVELSRWVSAFAEIYRDGLLMGTQFYRGPDVPLNISQYWVGTPGAGAFDLEAVPNSVLDDSLAYAADAVWSWFSSDLEIDKAFSAMGAVTGLSTGGRVTITEYVAPTDAVFGVVRGEIEATYRTFDADGVEGEEATLTASFNVPVHPRSLFNGHVTPPFVLRGQNPAPPPPSSNGFLGGQVVRDDVHGLEGITVRMRKDGTEITTATTFAGNYYFPNLEPGEWTLDFVVPEEYMLALGQRESITLTVSAGDTLYMPIHLADADGTGLLLVAVDADSAYRLADVDLEVYETGTQTLVAQGTTTGDMMVYTGRHPFKLAPGMYDVRVIVPEGYEIAEGSAELAVQVPVRTGHATSVGFRFRKLP